MPKHKGNRMTKKTFTLVAAIILCLGVGLKSADAQTVISKIDPKIFPEAQKGFKKMIIEVPYSSNDADKKIEFYVGKWMDVDGCNTFNLMGSYEQKDLQGWGYSYWVFNTKGDVRSTMMACPDQKGRHLFVSANPEIVDYNGRMPIVIYVPEGYDVQFKIFKAANETYQAAESK